MTGPARLPFSRCRSADAGGSRSLYRDDPSPRKSGARGGPPPALALWEWLATQTRRAEEAADRRRVEAERRRRAAARQWAASQWRTAALRQKVATRRRTLAAGRREQLLAVEARPREHCRACAKDGGGRGRGRRPPSYPPGRGWRSFMSVRASGTSLRLPSPSGLSNRHSRTSRAGHCPSPSSESRQTGAS